MGRNLLKEAIANPRVEVMGLSDPHPEAIDIAQGLLSASVAGYASHNELLARCDLDGVVIATPQYLHRDMCIASLEAGCTTFCEKPMAMNVRQCQDILDASRQAGKGIMIGHVLRYTNVYRAILDWVRSGELGRPVAMRVMRSMGQWGGEVNQPWRCRRESCGGLLLEVSIHEIDLMRCVMGEAASVCAQGRRFINDQVDYEDYISAEIEFRSGGIGHLTTSICDLLGKKSGEICLEKGTLYYDSPTQQVSIGRDGKGREIIPYASIHPEWESGRCREMREFIEACLGEREITIPGEEGLRAVEIAEAACRSIQEKRAIRLPLEEK
jgi:predicted dehydrogenase